MVTNSLSILSPNIKTVTVWHKKEFASRKYAILLVSDN